MTGAVLWTAGGARIGIGHLTRCRALAGALAQAGADPLIVMEGDPKLAGYAAGEGFAVEIAESREALWAALAGRLTGGGVAVLDRPGLEAADIERLRALGAESIVLLAGEGLGRVPADLAVMDDPEPCGPPAAARRVETGLQFHMVRPDVLAARPAAPWAAGEVRRVLVALGGADPGGLTEPFCAALAAAAPELRIAAVAGPAWDADRREAFRAAGEAEMIDAPPDMIAPILQSDAVITLGGRSTYEAFALGRPALCLRWEEMAGYCDMMERAGLAAAIGPDPAAAARQALAAFHDPEALAARAARAFTALDGKAADRVAALCLETER
ncbi:hypothetical protein FKB34_12125 [Glycocaulis profundi]|nr:hypothetical protein FKB34_12125 [Glycocaulis profundi]